MFPSGTGGGREVWPIIRQPTRMVGKPIPEVTYRPLNRKLDRAPTKIAESTGYKRPVSPMLLTSLTITFP